MRGLHCNDETRGYNSPSGVGSMRYLVVLILRSKVDWSTTPTGVDPAILLPSTLWNERLGMENGGTGG